MTARLSDIDLTRKPYIPWKQRGEFEHIMSTHVPTTNSPCCAMTLTKINMPCRSRSKAAYTRRNCRFCDSCKLVNFFFMLTKSLLWDLLTFLEYVGVLLLHAVTFRCRDLWRRLIALFAFRMTSVPLGPMKLPLSLWFGFNFDLLTLLMSAPLCAHPFRLTTFMVDGWRGGRRKEFQLSHHSVPWSILQLCWTLPDPSIKLSMNMKTQPKTPKIIQTWSANGRRNVLRIVAE